ncbi:PREDICTED: uncharacterized protein LOC109174437 [Ipomoea nil]|uniref:uncharacterized protein LOC109174437 n=1 Tax=Ipomoea nil TaxID=35883 RepID=UPI00090161DF|nr:PREDICTED: uncharacterized protein LOC109174437 [Ipomoea nil]
MCRLLTHQLILSYYSNGYASTVSSVIVSNLKTGVRKGAWDKVEAAAESLLITSDLSPADLVRPIWNTLRILQMLKNQSPCDENSYMFEGQFMVIACADSRVCPSVVLGFQHEKHL